MSYIDFQALSLLPHIECSLRKFCEVKSYQFFHYTSRSGLIGILESGKPSLWFSQYDCLNDPSERLDIEMFLKKYCERKLETGDFSKEFANMVMSLKGQDRCYVVWHDESYNIGKVKECYTYICSFSEDGDSLPMWNYYTKSDNKEGYNIMFKPYHFNGNVGHCNGFKLELKKVIYDDKTKNEFADKMLLDISKLYDKGTAEYKECVKAVLQTIVNKFQFVFKNEAFQYEKEVRAILRVPTDFKEDEYISVRRERGDNFKIPYVSFNVPGFKHLIVMTSPTTKNIENDLELRDIVEKAGYTNTKFLNSIIPFRKM